MVESEFYKKPWPEGYGTSDFEYYSPVEEAEGITKDAALQDKDSVKESLNSLGGNLLWGYTAATFETTLKNGIDQNKDNVHQNFAVFDWTSNAYGNLQIAINTPAKSSVNEVAGYGHLIGSIFLTRESENGRDVLSYSMFSNPDGVLIDRQVGSFSDNFDIDLLSGEYRNGESYLGNASFHSLDANNPVLTNQEILSVTDLVTEIANASVSNDSEEQGAYDRGGTGLGIDSASIESDN